MENKYLTLSLVFCFGYIASDIVTAAGVFFSTTAEAKVADMDSFDLMRDTDFKRAVTELAEDAISSYNYTYDRNFKRAVTNIVEGVVEDCDYSSGSISC